MHYGEDIENRTNVEVYESASGILQSTVSSMYKTLRIVAIVALLSILVYVGIRIVISSASKDKAKYKQMLIDWLVAFILLFVLHYLMAFIIDVSEKLTNICNNSNIENVRFEIPGNTLLYNEITKEYEPIEGYNTGGGRAVWGSNFMGYIRFYAGLVQQKGYSLKGIAYTVMYIVLVIYTIVFTFQYLRRVLYMAFLTMISPLVAITYPLDKINDGKAQGFNMWLKEYIFNALLQPIHYVIYVIIMGSVMLMVVNHPVYALVALGFMIPAEKFIRKMFGFEKAGTVSAFGGAAGAAMLMNGVQKLTGKSPHKSKDDNGAKGTQDKQDGKVRTISSIPNNRSGEKATTGTNPMETVGTKAMNTAGNAQKNRGQGIVKNNEVDNSQGIRMANMFRQENNQDNGIVEDFEKFGAGHNLNQRIGQGKLNEEDLPDTGREYLSYYRDHTPHGSNLVGNDDDYIVEDFEKFGAGHNLNQRIAQGELNEEDLPDAGREYLSYYREHTPHDSTLVGNDDDYMVDDFEKFGVGHNLNQRIAQGELSEEDLPETGREYLSYYRNNMPQNNDMVGGGEENISSQNTTISNPINKTKIPKPGDSDFIGPLPKEKRTFIDRVKTGYRKVQNSPLGLIGGHYVRRLDNRARKARPLRTMRRALTSGIGALTMGAIGLAAGIASGDASKAFQYTTAGALAGKNLGRNLGDKASDLVGLDGATKAFKAGALGDAQGDIERQKYKRDFKNNVDNYTAGVANVGANGWREMSKKGGVIDTGIDYGIKNIDELSRIQKTKEKFMKDHNMKEDEAQDLAFKAYKLDSEFGDYSKNPKTRERLEKNLIFNGYTDDNERKRITEGMVKAMETYQSVSNDESIKEKSFDYTRLADTPRSTPTDSSTNTSSNTLSTQPRTSTSHETDTSSGSDTTEEASSQNIRTVDITTNGQEAPIMSDNIPRSNENDSSSENVDDDKANNNDNELFPLTKQATSQEENSEVLQARALAEEERNGAEMKRKSEQAQTEEQIQALKKENEEAKKSQIVAQRVQRETASERKAKIESKNNATNGEQGESVADQRKTKRSVEFKSRKINAVSKSTGEIHTVRQENPPIPPKTSPTIPTSGNNPKK